ncbi:MAG: hypothetical protein UU40_C0001G0018 [Candidatus Uhrbacteria bacterium GW2011_GWD2_41_121]|nr:MAG: hypothetical protein UU40_C0001G0018 [Candidatus Uhrbacteria bacterium GW2011_GWD2_41_121]KKS07545.1 MAG: hypothetical protein UU62_C0015G0018 [Candidatus Uhrbacteria bacterium GW2011_GWF2_41_40]KKS18307.1 MAG: hypothetical protein UU75_C0005G0018 [Candidatus Uhrbacteria bacterium GW2011_GWB1_41_7]
MAIMSAFQAEDEGSILSTRSKKKSDFSRVFSLANDNTTTPRRRAMCEK